MNIIEQAKDFVNLLLHPNDPRRCAYCQKKMIKKNGAREVTIRDLDGVRAEESDVAIRGQFWALLGDWGGESGRDQGSH